MLPGQHIYFFTCNIHIYNKNYEIIDEFSLNFVYLFYAKEYYFILKNLFLK